MNQRQICLCRQFCHVSFLEPGVEAHFMYGALSPRPVRVPCWTQCSSVVRDLCNQIAAFHDLEKGNSIFSVREQLCCFLEQCGDFYRRRVSRCLQIQTSRHSGLQGELAAAMPLLVTLSRAACCELTQTFVDCNRVHVGLPLVSLTTSPDIQLAHQCGPTSHIHPNRTRKPLQML
jgi:hypothetical protein